MPLLSFFLGCVFIPLPFIVLTIVMLRDSGIQEALIVWGLVIATVGTVSVGAWLITRVE